MEWYITGSPARHSQSTVGKNQFSPSLVLGISTDLFKNTIYISFGQGWDGTGDQFKIDICQGQHRQKDRPEIYGTVLRGIINQNVKEAGPESNPIPTEQETASSQSGL